MSRDDAPIKAYSRAVGSHCPMCGSFNVGTICHVKEKFICMKCQHEFEDENEPR